MWFLLITLIQLPDVVHLNYGSYTTYEECVLVLDRLEMNTTGTTNRITEDHLMATYGHGTSHVECKER